MSLLDLPTELLQMVIADSRPDGIEALVQTCKKVFETAEGPILDEHHSYRMNYTNLLEIISFYMRPKSGERGYLGPNVILYEPGEVSLALLDEPLAGQYIKLLELADSSEDTFQMAEAETGGFENIPGRERLLPLVEQSKYIKAAEQFSSQYPLPEFLQDIPGFLDLRATYTETHASIWRTGILKGNRCASFGLLLTLAPNLRELRYSFHGPEQSWYIGPVVRAAAADGSCSTILSKLEVLEIRNFDPFLIQELCPYLALPSIKRIEVMGVAGWELNDWQYKDRTSTVEEIDVYAGNVDGCTIGQFLKPLEKLRVLHWTYGCGSMNECQDWDGNAFVQTIGITVGWHLQELGLTFTHTPQCVSTTGIDHLLRFRTLKYLELDLRFLFAKLDLKRNRKRLQSMPLLIDILPSSIESVRLWVSKSISRPERMLEHVTRLSNLKQITIMYHVPEEHRLRNDPPEPFPPLPAHQFHAVAHKLEPMGINLDVVGSRGPPGLWRRNCKPDEDHLYTPAEMLPAIIQHLDIDVSIGYK
ncbi:hypothetical protein FKW77_002348 [Venturia effusa]|uniref:F-box domain-containing protein n=1 Tax=Venturia effusa TaxID=50376 RepID=A0A517LPN8_9PEZI|nr:hypothetical protein FKW77_002348 [Venturia effusa]